jgi:hypothetical protein
MMELSPDFLIILMEFYEQKNFQNTLKFNYFHIFVFYQKGKFSA